MSANSPIPAMRIPPVMPPRAKRSGRVIVKFDVGRDGKPMNIEPIQASEEVFLKPAIRSVSAWEYDVSEDIAPDDLTGIVSTIIFKLSDMSGRILPERPLVDIDEL